ncbi:MAG TPA: (4Fe-4S)-binding protein [Vicinamibacterales bacterium]|nr:(4Fe-4S)-binding protein [Vicinamibacterales bacterium]
MQEFQNDAIIVRYDPRVCTHSGHCVRGLASVFDVSRQPWIDVNGAAAEAIARQVAQCPSGALTAERRAKG